MMAAPSFASALAGAVSQDPLSDFDALYTTLKRAHFDLFAHRPRAAYDALFARLRRQLMSGSAGAGETVALFQRFVAFGRVAHARIDSAGQPYRDYRNGGGAIFPCGIRVKQGRVFVADPGGTEGLLPGDELLAVEGQGLSRLISVFWRDVSADTRYMMEGMLEWEMPRMIWQRFGPRDAFRLSVRTATSPSRTVLARARSRAELKTLASLGRPRLDLAALDRTVRFPEPGTAYLRPGPFYAAETPERPYDNTAFKAFIDGAFEQILMAGSQTLILDLRDNPGGDNSFSDHLIAWFADRPFRFASRFSIRVSPEAIASNRARLAIAGNDPTGISEQFDELYKRAQPGSIADFPVPWARPREGARFTGRVFVLIDRLSYSNTVTVAALIQDFGLGVILGEETSDLATTYGAMETFALPLSGTPVGFPKARIIRPNGSLLGRGVVPDRAIATPAVEGADDPVLREALAITNGLSE